MQRSATNWPGINGPYSRVDETSTFNRRWWNSGPRAGCKLGYQQPQSIRPWLFYRYEVQVAASAHFLRRGVCLTWHPQAILVPGIAASIT